MTTQDTSKTSRTTSRPDAADRVPEWAEGMEHTLRRLMADTQKRHGKTPGLYR